MVCICRKNGWIQPTVYQGIYNAIHRCVPSNCLHILPPLLTMNPGFGFILHHIAPSSQNYFLACANSASRSMSSTHVRRFNCSQNVQTDPEAVRSSRRWILHREIYVHGRSSREGISLRSENRGRGMSHPTHPAYI